MKLLSLLLLAVLLFAAGIVPLVDAFLCDANGQCILDDGSVVPCININTNGSCVIMYGGDPVTFRDPIVHAQPAPPLGQQWELSRQNIVFDATPESITKIKNFLNNLYANIVRRGDARTGLMNAPAVWADFEEMAVNGAWSGQNTWNAALTKVKDEIRRVYGMDWTANGNIKEGSDNWAYSLFLLRALLEFFKNIFRKARGIQKVTFLFCITNVRHAVVYNPACLDDPEERNGENIRFINDWFASNRASAAAKVHYADYKNRIAYIFNVNLFGDYNTSVGHNNQQNVVYNRPAPAGAQWQLVGHNNQQIVYNRPVPVGEQWQIGRENTTKFYGNRASIIKIKNFVEKLHASSINSGRQNVSLGLMKSNDPTVWAQFEEMAINGWDSQPEWNNALNRVKNEIRRDYALDWAPNVDKRNGGPNNWAYALFLLRALLEFFKEIFNKVAGNVVVIFCTANGVQAGTFGSSCLTDLKGTNDANIKLIDEYFKKRCNNRTVKGKYAKYTTRIANFFNVEIVAGGPSPTPYNYDASTILQKQTVNLVLSPAYMDDIMKFIERFHEKLPVNGNNARQTLYTTTDLFKSFLLTINSQWSGQNTMNVAFHRIREFVNTAYGLHQEKRQQFRRKFEENWTYDMFMLRAVFELFKAIIGAIKMVMGPRGSDNYRQILATICPNGLFYHGHMYTSTTPKNCLEALAEMNNENIAKLGQWFTTKDPASTRRGENYQNFQRQNYEDFKTKIDNVFVATVSGAPSLPSPRIQEWEEPVQQLPRVPFNDNVQNSFVFSGGFDANDGVLSFQHEYHPHGGKVQWNYHHNPNPRRPVGMRFEY